MSRVPLHVFFRFLYLQHRANIYIFLFLTLFSSSRSSRCSYLCTNASETYVWTLFVLIFVCSPRRFNKLFWIFPWTAANSFLLHGYYNYRHILVGPMSEYSGTVMRIGVPGNYYKREEVVAKMFGFPEFVPAKGEKKTGAFGYYYSIGIPLENS